MISLDSKNYEACANSDNLDLFKIVDFGLSLIFLLSIKTSTRNELL